MVLHQPCYILFVVPSNIKLLLCFRSFSLFIVSTWCSQQVIDDNDDNGDYNEQDDKRGRHHQKDWKNKDNEEGCNDEENGQSPKDKQDGQRVDKDEN